MNAQENLQSKLLTRLPESLALNVLDCLSPNEVALITKVNKRQQHCGHVFFQLRMHKIDTAYAVFVRACGFEAKMQAETKEASSQTHTFKMFFVHKNTIFSQVLSQINSIAVPILQANLSKYFEEEFSLGEEESFENLFHVQLFETNAPTSDDEEEPPSTEYASLKTLFSILINEFSKQNLLTSASFFAFLNMKLPPKEVPDGCLDHQLTTKKACKDWFNALMKKEVLRNSVEMNGLILSRFMRCCLKTNTPEDFFKECFEMLRHLQEMVIPKVCKAMLEHTLKLRVRELESSCLNEFFIGYVRKIIIDELERLHSDKKDDSTKELAELAQLQSQKLSIYALNHFNAAAFLWNRDEMGNPEDELVSLSIKTFLAKIVSEKKQAQALQFIINLNTDGFVDPADSDDEHFSSRALAHHGHPIEGLVIQVVIDSILGEDGSVDENLDKAGNLLRNFRVNFPSMTRIRVLQRAYNLLIPACLKHNSSKAIDLFCDMLKLNIFEADKQAIPIYRPATNQSPIYGPALSNLVMQFKAEQLLKRFNEIFEKGSHPHKVLLFEMLIAISEKGDMVDFKNVADALLANFHNHDEFCRFLTLFEYRIIVDPGLCLKLSTSFLETCYTSVGFFQLKYDPINLFQACKIFFNSQELEQISEEFNVLEELQKDAPLMDRHRHKIMRGWIDHKIKKKVSAQGKGIDQKKDAP